MVWNTRVQNSQNIIVFFSFKCTFEIQFETELERDWERGREGVMTSPIMCQCDWQRGSWASWSWHHLVIYCTVSYKLAKLYKIILLLLWCTWLVRPCHSSTGVDEIQFINNYNVNCMIHEKKKILFVIICSLYFSIVYFVWSFVFELLSSLTSLGRGGGGGRLPLKYDHYVVYILVFLRIISILLRLFKGNTDWR